MLKKIIFIFLISISLFCCLHKKPNNGKFSIKVSVLGKPSVKPFFDTVAFVYPIKIELLNSTDSIISFWSMCCSWQDNWLTKNRLSRIYGEENCDKNFPEVYNIKPDSCIVYEGCLVAPDTTKKLNKLGLILIGEKEIENEREFTSKVKEKAKEKKDVFWSNEFVLN